jgi:hypothetical protein
MNNAERFGVIYIASLGLLIATIISCSFLGFKKKESAPAQRVDVFYILTSRSYIDIDGDTSVILDYAKNGEVQIQGVFESNKERDAFIAHLSAIGKVLNTGATK